MNGSQVFGEGTTKKLELQLNSSNANAYALEVIGEAEDSNSKLSKRKIHMIINAHNDGKVSDKTLNKLKVVCARQGV